MAVSESDIMQFEKAIAKLIKRKELADGTIAGYWQLWRAWRDFGGPTKIEQIRTKHIRDFLKWEHRRAKRKGNTNPERCHNLQRERFRALLRWCERQGFLDLVPRIPEGMKARNVAGLFYMSHEQIDALYDATYQMRIPEGWTAPHHIGAYWRAALVLFVNYGMDTGTVFSYLRCHRPVLWKDIYRDQTIPGQHQRSEFGWLFYRRVKTKKSFVRPMNAVIRAHLEAIAPSEWNGDPVCIGGGARPSIRFQQLCECAQVRPKVDLETGREMLWKIKDLRKTAATLHDANLPGSASAVLGHSLGGSAAITAKHYSSPDPRAFEAITTLPQPESFRRILE